MKPLIFTVAWALPGFLAGYFISGSLEERQPSQTTDNVRLSPRKARGDAAWNLPGQTSAQRLKAMADHAVSLTRDEWPAFFQSRIHSPEGSEFAERLWAEQDPDGFWSWLKQQRDGNTLTQYGRNLLRIWAASDPDAAMRAANEITDKQSSDILRCEVIETVMAKNLQKGLQLASEALDFNGFAWGERPWMKTNPAAAVQGLAALPPRSEFRHYLNYAVEEWAKTDSHALLNWLSHQQSLQGEEWFGKAFTAAASADLGSALESAGLLTDPILRDAAISGVLASGSVTDERLSDLLGQLTLPRRADAMYAALDKLPLENETQIAHAARLLNQAPANRNMLNLVGEIGQAWAGHDIQNGFAWAAALPDSSMRRKALAGIASCSSKPEQLDVLASHAAQVPMLDLSNEFFQIVMSRLPDGKREEWIARLPKDRAEWARSVAAAK